MSIIGKGMQVCCCLVVILFVSSGKQSRLSLEEDSCVARELVANRVCFSLTLPNSLVEFAACPSQARSVYPASKNKTRVQAFKLP